jgi:hypothetical protein
MILPVTELTGCRSRIWQQRLLRSGHVPNWQVGDTIPLGGDRMLRVIEVRPGSNADDNPVLVVEHV